MRACIVVLLYGRACITEWAAAQALITHSLHARTPPTHSTHSLHTTSLPSPTATSSAPPTHSACSHGHRTSHLALPPAFHTSSRGQPVHSHTHLGSIRPPPRKKQPLLTSHYPLISTHELLLTTSCCLLPSQPPKKKKQPGFSCRKYEKSSAPSIGSPSLVTCSQQYAQSST